MYTIGRNVRTVQDVLKEVNPDDSKQTRAKSEETRPVPQNKRVRATMEGKDTAFTEINRQILQRDPEEKKQRVALMDGEAALHRKVKQYLRGFILILDIFHVIQYLWKAVYVLYAEGSVEAQKWVEQHLRMILEGKVGYVIGGLRQSLTKRSLSISKKKVLEGVIGYFEKNQRFMRYDEYLKRGYPIGSGVGEGACRHLVKDHMELAGMRCNQAGAQAMLELRAVYVNGDWDDFWHFRTEQKYRELYGRYPLPSETQRGAA